MFVAVPEVADLAHAVDVVQKVDSSLLGDEALTEAITELHRLQARIASAEAELVGAWDARRVWAGDGSKSGGAALAHRCMLPRAVAHGKVRLARRLRSMPLTAAALAAGEISVDHARALSRLNRPDTAAASADGEANLVDAAKNLSFAEFHRCVSYWDAAAAPDRTEDHADRRRFHASETFDDMVIGDFVLDPIGGTIFTEELRRIEHQMFLADWKDAEAVHGVNAIADKLARTPAQRRADALVEMARRSAAMPPGARKPAPLITVLVGYETFAGPVHEIANTGAVVTPGRIASLLPDADIERVVFDSPSRVIDVGETRRYFTGALRRAIEVRDRTCAHPTCDTPAQQCEIDHVKPFTKGGPTHQDNGTPRCGVHNRQKSDDDPP